MKQQNNNIIKSTITKKPQVETLVLRVLRCVDPVALLHETGAYQSIKMIKESAAGTFKICIVDVVF